MFQDPPIWKSGFGRHPAAKDTNNTTDPPAKAQNPESPKNSVI